MVNAKLYANDGAAKGEVELPASHFEQPISEGAMHLAVEVYLANQRQGTHKSKARWEISGSTKKPWKQKGTGRARAGSNTSPIWVRGNKAHGPNPRDYSKKLNKKIRQKALLSALSLRAKENGVSVFESLEMEEAKTKKLYTVLKTAQFADSKNVIVVNRCDDKLLLAARNIPNLIIQRVSDIHTYGVLNNDNLIFTNDAISALTSPKAEGGAE